MRVDNKAEVVRYVLIPLPLVRNLFLKEDAVNDMLDYGIYSYSTTITVNSEDAFSNLVDCYYHNRNALTDSLLFRLDNYVSDEVLPSQSEDGQQISNELLRYIIDEEDDENFIEEVKTWYRVFFSYLRFELKPKTVKFTIDNYLNISSTYGYFKKDCPLIAVGVRYLLDAQKRKSLNERILLAYQLGIMSIIGMHRQWCATTKDMIRARMFGFKNFAEMHANVNETLAEFIDKLSSRWAMDKMRDEAMTAKLLRCCFGYGRRVYVSATKSFDEIKNEIADSLNSQQQKNERKRQRLELELLLTKQQQL